MFATAALVLWWHHNSRSNEPPISPVAESPNQQGTSSIGAHSSFDETAPTTTSSPRTEHQGKPISPVPNVAESEPVSGSLARKAAEAFLQTEKSRNSTATNTAVNLQDFHITMTEAVAENGGSPLAYIHTLSPTGFVITSAQTGIRPIVGFSFKDAFPFRDSADNVLLHLLRADMTARSKTLNCGSARDSVQSNVMQWAQFNRK